MPRVLLGATAHNPHVQNMARALYEADALAMYVTGGVDGFRAGPARLARNAVVAMWPAAGAQLSRRRVPGIPSERLRTRWRWELPRLVANRLRAPRVEDWCWDRGERGLDRACARLVRRPAVSAFLGVEYGACAAVRSAETVGKPGIVAFLSPHHRTYARWVGAEIERHPELRSGAHAAIDRLTAERDHRRDVEAAAASCIVTNSSFTTRSLVDAGVDAKKVLTLPLGGPDPIDRADLPSRREGPVKVMYAGPVSVRKGAHYLLRAWRRVAGPGVELHLYGAVLLPEAVMAGARRAPGGDSIVVHGPVPAAELSDAYRRSDVLVLPTLCDGFGQVVLEAMASGLPVITTRNAGAADVIDDGRTGVVIEAADEEALTGALQWAVEHPRALFDMRGAAWAAAARWTWRGFRARFRSALGPVVGGLVEDAVGAREAVALG